MLVFPTTGFSFHDNSKRDLSELQAKCYFLNKGSRPFQINFSFFVRKIQMGFRVSRRGRHTNKLKTCSGCPVNCKEQCKNVLHLEA